MMTPDDRAWRLSGGKVEELTLPPHPARYYVPEGVTCQALDTQKPEPVCLIPGRHDPDYESFTLPLVSAIARRMTPWATWYFAPTFFGCQDYTGMAWGESEVAICRTSASPCHAVRIAFHEGWHLAEALLRPALLEELDAQLSSGPPWPGDYYRRPCERRARAFANFAMLLTEGCQQVCVGPAVPAEIELFWGVYNGDVGQEIMRARAPRRSGILSRVTSPFITAARAAQQAVAARRADA